MKIASNAKQVLTEFNNRYKSVEQTLRGPTGIYHISSYPRIEKREMDGIKIKTMRSHMWTEEIWQMKGLDDVIEKYVENFFSNYAPEGYSSFVLKLGKNKYYFYNSNSCD